MSDQARDVPSTPEGLAEWMGGLTFERDREVPRPELPPVLAEGEDVLVPRSFKIPQRIDEALAEIAAGRGAHVTKSDIVREFLEAGVAAEMAARGEPEVLIPLADALRALTGLRHLPRTA
jgi:hypothetical protein